MAATRRFDSVGSDFMATSQPNPRAPPTTTDTLVWVVVFGVALASSGVLLASAYQGWATAATSFETATVVAVAIALPMWAGYWAVRDYALPRYGGDMER